MKSAANRGRDVYPVTLTEAFNLLVRESGEYDSVSTYNPRHRSRGGRGGRGRHSFLFAQTGRGGGGSGGEVAYSRMNTNNCTEIVAGADGKSCPDTKCYGCQFFGRYRNQCPYVTRTSVISMHLGCMLTQGALFTIPKIWVLLDTCSTCNVSNNPNLVTNIRDCEPENFLTAYTNGGAQLYRKEADLKLLPLVVHYKPDSMATILSLKSVSEINGTRLVMDTNINKHITLTLKDGMSYIFKQFENGLYFLDTDNAEHFIKTKTTLSNYSLLQTVADNKTYFTKQEIRGADTSRKLQKYLYYPSTNTFKTYVTKKY